MDKDKKNSNQKFLSIGEIVTEDYRTAEVFSKFGIDFCCGGKDPLEETCSRKGINVHEVIQALKELEENTIKGDTPDYNSWELDFMVDYIVNTHHTYVIRALPQLDEMSTKVATVHGETHPEVIKIAGLYNAIAEELRMHMHKEENILFPYIKQMAVAKRNNESIQPSPFGTIENPIKMMEMEHESAGGNMQTINSLSNGFNTPEGACNTYQVLYAKLQEFEDDLHRHIHLENHILFPKAIALESELLS
jgi:regulator of cell morphogenesis and NO signaling